MTRNIIFSSPNAPPEAFVAANVSSTLLVLLGHHLPPASKMLSESILSGHMYDKLLVPLRDGP